MVHYYSCLLSRGVSSSVFSLDLADHPVVSSLHLKTWWDYHCLSCQLCSSRGSWDEARLANSRNPCYFAYIVAWLWNGWIPPFAFWPAPCCRSNYEAVALAPSSVQHDCDESLRFGATIPVSSSPFISPLLLVVRQHDIDAAVQKLSAASVPFDPSLVKVNVDYLKHLLQSQVSSDGIPWDPIKTRLVNDFSHTINASVLRWPFSYPGIQDVFPHIIHGSWFSKIDLSKFFWQLPLHPGFYKYFSFQDLSGNIYSFVRAPSHGSKPSAGFC